MDKSKLKPIYAKYKQYLLLSIFFSLLIGLVMFEFNQIINEKIIAIQQKKGQLQSLQNRISNLDKLQADYNNLFTDVNMINTLLPKQDQIINIIGKIETMAQDDNVELTTKFSSEPANHKLPATLTVKGYFADVFKFYQGLTGNDLLIYVKAIDMSDNNNMLDNVKATIETEIYFD